MTGEEVREARLALKLSLAQMATMLGYQSSNNRNLNTMMRDIESGSKPVREPQRRLAQAYLEGYRPADWPI